MKATLASALAVPALALLALAGCTTGGVGGSGTDETSPGDAGSAGGAAGCATGHVWSADVDDMAEQLYQRLLSTGSPVQSTAGEGSQVLDWGADGGVQLDTDYTFTVVSALGDGLIMTMNQSHQGPSTGVLAIDGDVATPTEFDSSGYLVTTKIDINGTASEAAFPLPESVWTEGVGLDIVSCNDTTLKTFAHGGFVTQTWSRQD